jgi:hypothetical protein
MNILPGSLDRAKTKEKQGKAGELLPMGRTIVWKGLD